MRHTPIHLIFAVILLFLGGCTYRPGIPEKAALVPREEWVSAFKARSDYWKSFQASLHIKVEGPGKTLRARTVVLARMPGQLRLEAYGPLGQTIGVLVTGSDGASLFIPSEKVIYTAARAERLIGHFLGVPISLEALGYALIASVPPNQVWTDLQSLPLHTGSVLHSVDPQNNWGFDWELLNSPRGLKSIAVREGPWKYTVEYDPAVGLPPQDSPGRISFVSTQWRMDVTVDQMKPSDQIQDSAFDRPFPAGIRRMSLDTPG